MKIQRILLAIAISLAMASPALCASIVGIVSDTNGNFVNGVKITVVDASGKQVGQATSDAYGRYCIGPIQPGKYTVKLDPARTGFQGGNGVVELGQEGATVDWSTSATAAALAATSLGVASAAAATCGGGWWDTAAVAAGGVVAGGGAAGALLPGEEPSGGPTTPPATSFK